jgi:hypothetical protein
MEAIRSSETSGTTQRTTRRHIPEEDTLQNHRCENLKSYMKEVALLRSNVVNYSWTEISKVHIPQGSWQDLRFSRSLRCNNLCDFNPIHRL